MLNFQKRPLFNEFSRENKFLSCYPTQHNRISTSLSRSNSKAGRYFRRLALFIFTQLLNSQNEKVTFFFCFFFNSIWAMYTKQENNVVFCLWTSYIPRVDLLSFPLWSAFNKQWAWLDFSATFPCKISFRWESL